MVPMNDETASKLEDAARQVAEYKEAYDAARALREEVIREAALTGANYREIASASGVSYQRVAQLLTGEKPYAYPYQVTILIRCPNCGAKPREECAGARGRQHAERNDRCQQIISSEVEPEKNELHPGLPFYCRMKLAMDRFPQCIGDLSTNPKDIALKPSEFLGVWTGRKWERVDTSAMEDK